MVGGGIRAVPAPLPSSQMAQAVLPRLPKAHGGAPTHPARPQVNWGQLDVSLGHLEVPLEGPGRRTLAPPRPRWCAPFILWAEGPNPSPIHRGTCHPAPGPLGLLTDTRGWNDSGDMVIAFQRMGEMAFLSW